ncbi:MAG: malonyl-CoA decarboxylase family protein [Emcibacter sp.]|nr:malonyl-CoA decarboxylase family protein [Emcibacter sp.]
MVIYGGLMGITSGVTGGLAKVKSNGYPLDPVARFHLGNGASLERINWLSDTSKKGMNQSLGMMVNYLYDIDKIQKNHERYAALGEITLSSSVQKLLKS